MPGGAASGRKGSAYERELVNRFDAAGWGALRLPSSGSATDRDLPDVLAGRPETVWHMIPPDDVEPGDPPPIDWEEGEDFKRRSKLFAIELKSGKATTLYVDAAEVRDLEAFAATWGARPLLGARFTTQATDTAHWLLAPEAARGPTGAGRYGLPVSDIKDRAFAVVRDGEVVRV